MKKSTYTLMTARTYFKDFTVNSSIIKFGNFIDLVCILTGNVYTFSLVGNSIYPTDMQSHNILHSETLIAIEN